MTDPVIRKSVFLNATPATVWGFLTEAKQLARWFHAAEADLVAGAPYRLLGENGDAICWGEVHEAEPHSRLRYSFTIKPMNGLMTDVEWTLLEVSGGTQLSLIHKGLPAGAEAFGLALALDEGWDKHLGTMRDQVA